MKCEWPICHREATHGKYCYDHYRLMGTSIVKESNPQPIAKKSDKAAKEDRKYKKLVKEMLAQDDRCELKIEGVCTGKAEGLHHLKRRGKNLTNKEFLKRACNACNQHVEQHPLEAIEAGLLSTKYRQ